MPEVVEVEYSHQNTIVERMAMYSLSVSARTGRTKDDNWRPYFRLLVRAVCDAQELLARPNSSQTF
jgi:hypothetical protein